MFGRLETKQFYFLTFLLIWTTSFTITCFYFIARDYKKSYRRFKLEVSPYKPHRLLENLPCSLYLSNHTDAIEAYIPIEFSDPTNLSMECEDIKKRRNFEEKVYREEEEFPLAFVRTVYKDYIHLEMELSAHYSPNNFYCYVLDSKADDIFKKRLRSLAKCFKNVIVTKTEFDMTSGGRNIVIGQYHGLELLMKKKRKWKYVLMLENHDILIKTNYELVQILRLYEGANDVHAVNIKKLSVWRQDQLKNYTLEQLHLFKNSNKSSDITQSLLVNVKGYNQAVLSYEAVDYIFKELNIITMLDVFNGDFHEEEFFTSSLNANEAIGLPGGFTTKCLKWISFQSMVRYTQWSDTGDCRYKARHFICVLGMADIPTTFLQSPHFTLNKVMGEVDFGVIGCWHEHMYNRQHFHREDVRNTEVYTSLPFVEYHRLRKVDRLDEFNCKKHKFGVAKKYDPQFSIYTL